MKERARGRGGDLLFPGRFSSTEVFPLFWCIEGVVFVNPMYPFLHLKVISLNNSQLICSTTHNVTNVRITSTKRNPNPLNEPARDCEKREVWLGVRPGLELGDTNYHSCPDLSKLAQKILRVKLH